MALRGSPEVYATASRMSEEEGHLPFRAQTARA